MSASADLQAAIIELLGQPGALRVNVPTISRVTKDHTNDIEAAVAASGGFCIYVMPPLELEANSMQGGDLVFFDKAEVRVRIVEIPALNNTNATAYDLKDDVINFLHWLPKTPGTQLGAITSNPLQLAPRPVEMVEGMIDDGALKDRMARIIDVIFHATYGLEPNS